MEPSTKLFATDSANSDQLSLELSCPFLTLVLPPTIRTMASPPVDARRSSKRIVLKLGTQTVVTGEGRFALKNLSPFLKALATLHKNGSEVLIVSSGAVGLGRHHLHLLKGSGDLREKQACAAVGQSLLMVEYAKFFARHKIRVAQVLLTAADFSERARFLNLRNTLEKLLELRVIPIINENDVVSTQELTPLGKGVINSTSFGDNDRLSALVAGKLESDLLILLTDVDGVYTANPKKDAGAERIPSIESLEKLKKISTQGKSELGRGGMESKLEAARIASISGCHVVIGSRFPDLAQPLDHSGTWIKPQTKRLDQKKKWIGAFSGFSGVLILNEGAVRALLDKKASLLPGGVTDVQGTFKPGQIVSIQDSTGREWGRGIARYSNEEVSRIKGHKSSEIESLIGQNRGDEVVHRDHLVLFEEKENGNP